MPQTSKPPEDLSPWLGLWTEARVDDDNYNLVLGASGVPWAVRKLLQQFAAQREFVLPPSAPFLFRSKILTGTPQHMRM